MKNPRVDVGIDPYGPELKEISNKKNPTRAGGILIALGVFLLLLQA